MPLLGRNLTISRSDGAGAFVLVCITEQRSLEINNEEIDITKPSCTNPGGPLHAAFMYGIQTIRFTGNGAFVDDATLRQLVADSVNQVTETYQVSAPGVGTFEGDALFSITLSGEKTGELQGDFRFVMSGDVAFEALVP
ncbi:phage tail protein [Georhizobium profundi]|uniref:Phage tail protein n=1 Tax=Georhizobium profundi TaxID=2341112 RepID=A0A3S9B5Q4_9HYPH|nr:phage tail tube protein [Georhizobium profundi]AZN72254.1 phage tail protein [Georhizobium profundi]